MACSAQSVALVTRSHSRVLAVATAIALIALALPVSPLAPLITATHAQPSTPQWSIATGLAGSTAGGICPGGADGGPTLSTACYADATPGVAYMPVDTPHTTTFTCDGGIGLNASGIGANTRATLTSDLAGGNANRLVGLVPGCYDVSALVRDETNSVRVRATNAICGGYAIVLSGSPIRCASYASPLCPYGATTLPSTGAHCVDTDANAPRGSQLLVTINPGAPHKYLTTFNGYTPLLASCSAPPVAAVQGTPESVTTVNGRGICYTNPMGAPLGTVASGTAACTTTTVNPACGPTGPACPVGMTFVPGPFQVPINLFVQPFEAPTTAPDGMCRFSISSETAYAEIVYVALQASTGSRPCTEPALDYPPLHIYIGPACHFAARATGVVVLEQGVNCSGEPNGIPAPGFPPGSAYSCVGITLSVLIPTLGTSPFGPIPITYTVAGPGSFLQQSLSHTPFAHLHWCAGVPQATPYAAPPGADVALCPTGRGSGFVQACFEPDSDSQPAVCSEERVFDYR